MTTSKQLRYIATHPAAYVNFITSGRLPRSSNPRSPLIDLLLKLSPRDRAAIAGVTVSPDLGYSGTRQFPNAEAALRWMRPDIEMLEGQSWPAENYRDKRFAKVLTLDDLIAHTSHIPNHLLQRNSHLLAPSSAAGESSSDVSQPVD